MYQTSPEEPPNADEPPEGSTPTHTTVESPVADFKVTHRIHTRIVFKEVCDLRGDMQMLLGVLKVLQLLHSSGWVHRDVSPGNLMRIGGLVKLADLEYAKRLSSDKDSHGHSPLHGLRSGIAQLPLLRIVTIQNLFCSAFHVNLRDLHSHLTLFTTSSHCGGDGFGSCTSMPLRMGRCFPPNKLKHFDHCSPITCPPSGCLTSSPETDVHLAFRDVIRCAEIVRERLVKAYLDMGISLPPDYHQQQRRLLQFLNSLGTRHSKNSNAEVATSW
ncbi:hypothetical protein SCLCIDRAFT_967450 [Scleroderma citrinum Foug A]|uniref:Uncharacterized protein n=1 Tax=Scleroderma citrinum Foug A TaxID=1036808 RepID=A0A0C2ZEY3_9AGAM|nr:hypothetical protein SCLCIDRAFT_967450 [Scleroderma citrinum Foug A]